MRKKLLPAGPRPSEEQRQLLDLVLNQGLVQQDAYPTHFDILLNLRQTRMRACWPICRGVALNSVEGLQVRVDRWPHFFVRLFAELPKGDLYVQGICLVGRRKSEC